jgi:hypothetical protein
MYAQMKEYETTAARALLLYTKASKLIERGDLPSQQDELLIDRFPSEASFIP